MSTGNRSLVSSIALAVLVCLTGPAGALEPPSGGSPGVATAANDLRQVDRDLVRLGDWISEVERSGSAAPPGLESDIASVRPRIRHAVSLLKGLHWSEIRTVLEQVTDLHGRMALLEDRLKKAGSPRPFRPPVRQPSARAEGSGAIAGRITDSVTGAPVAGVVVFAGWWDSAATTNATGDYLIEGLQAGSYAVFTDNELGYVDELFDDLPCQNGCYPSGGSLVAVTDGFVTTGVNFGLERFGSLSGSVTDSATSQPISGVSLQLYNQSGSYWASASSGSAGTYAFSALPPGTYYLKTYSSRYFDQLYDGIPCEGSNACQVTSGIPIAVSPGEARTGVNFSLQLGATIKGRVTAAATGQPVAGTNVTLTRGDGSHAGSTSTGPTGSYAFDGLSAGTYFAVASGYSNYADVLYSGILCEPSCNVTSGTPIPAALGQVTSGIDFALPRFGAFQGRVTDVATGFPVSNATIYTYRSSGTLVDYSDYVDSDGGYTSGGLLSGNYFAVAMSPTHLDESFDDHPCQPACDPVTGTSIPVTLDSTSYGIDFALDLGGGVVGRVTAASSGLPLANLTVDLFDAGGAWLKGDTSNTQGDFTFTDLVPGTYFARASRDSSSIYMRQLFNGIPCEPSCTVTTGTPIPVTKGSATRGVNFALARFGSLSGVVTDARTGLPLTNRLVNVHDALGSYVRSAFTAEDGTFTVYGLLPGTYFASAAASGYISQLFNTLSCATPCTVTAGTPIPVQIGMDTPGINFALVPYGLITGTLTDATTGADLGYASLTLHDAGGNVVARSYSGADGVYLFGGLATGTYYLSTQVSSGYVNSLYHDLDCQPSCDVLFGTPIAATIGSLTSGIDIKLRKPFFADVSLDHWARKHIESAYIAGVTAGCATSPLSFCPNVKVSRWQMAVLLARAIAGSDAAVPSSGFVPAGGPYNCAPGGASLFPYDVPPTDSGCRHIHYIYSMGITSGCGDFSFCPANEITRSETAVFFARMLAGSDSAVPVSGTVPSAGTYSCTPGGASLFPADVPPTDSACRHIHYIYGEGVTLGCAPGAFCPLSTLPREQMAAFLARVFNLTRYNF
ncbi:MAG: carboxypeptidase regulatory-like domain-containing protein [Acidobacteria bacterium]|nr:carboxypeptidase regulatory-like domain-containing protein [Acidobacteriota bacterium]